MSGIQFSAQQGGVPDDQKEIIAMQGAAAIVAAAAKAKTLSPDSDKMCALLKELKKALLE